MAKNNKRPQRQKSSYVRGHARGLSRPQPPHEDRRTKRMRTRQSQDDFYIDEDEDWDEE